MVATRSADRAADVDLHMRARAAKGHLSQALHIDDVEAEPFLPGAAQVIIIDARECSDAGVWHFDDVIEPAKTAQGQVDVGWIVGSADRDHAPQCRPAILPRS